MRAPVIKTCIREVCDGYGCTPQDVVGTTRVQPVTLARQVAMSLVRECSEYSYTQIGVAFGGRDHSTVISAIRRVSEFRRDPDFDQAYLAMLQRVFAAVSKAPEYVPRHVLKGAFKSCRGRDKGRVQGRVS